MFDAGCLTVCWLLDFVCFFICVDVWCLLVNCLGIVVMFVLFVLIGCTVVVWGRLLSLMLMHLLFTLYLVSLVWVLLVQLLAALFWLVVLIWLIVRTFNFVCCCLVFCLWVLQFLCLFVCLCLMFGIVLCARLFVCILQFTFSWWCLNWFGLRYDCSYCLFSLIVSLLL